MHLRRRASEKYNGRFVEIKVRVTPDEKHSIIQERAAFISENTTAFMSHAIDKTMERDK